MKHIHDIIYTLSATQLGIYKSSMTVKHFMLVLMDGTYYLIHLFLLGDRNKIKCISGYKKGEEWKVYVHNFNIISHINLNGEKTQRNSYKIRNKQVWLLSPSLFTTVLKS